MNPEPAKLLLLLLHEAEPEGGNRMRKYLTLAGLVAAMAFCATWVQASSSYLTTFNTTYGTSGTPLNSCNLCHTNIPATNAYGSSFAANGHNFANIQNLDSDGDGFTNIAEISARTFPGDAASFPNTPPPPPPPPPAPGSQASIGVFRAGHWFFDADKSGSWSQGVDEIISFGMAGDLAIMGDWNGTDSVNIGVFRSGYWYLDVNGNNAWDGCSIDACLSFGLPEDIPVVGDWNGDGKTKIGVYRNGYWFLDFDGNGRWDSLTDKVFLFGAAGFAPVTGDWNASGTTKMGLFRNGQWFLDTNGTGVFSPGMSTVIIFGMPGDKPMTGDWNGDGKTKVGVFRNGAWYLDANGDNTWNGTNDISVASFGMPGDIPVAR